MIGSVISSYLMLGQSGRYEADAGESKIDGKTYQTIIMDGLALQALITWQLLHSCVGHEKDSHNMFSQTFKNTSISSFYGFKKSSSSPQ